MTNPVRGKLSSFGFVGLTVCGALAACACSSDAASTPTGSSGAPAAVAGSNNGAAGSNNTVAGSAGSGVAGSDNVAGTDAGGASAGTDSGGTGGTGGTADGTAGVAGSATGGTTAAGSGGASAGAGGGSAGSGTGGGAPCTGAGHAVSLSANGTGSAADGAKARVEFQLGADLPVGTTDRTVEVWAYMKQSDWTANDNTLFFYGTNNRKADGFGLDFGNSMGTQGTIDPFTNAIFDNDNQPSGVTTTTSQWVHFAMTWNGTAVQAYVNGILKATMAAPSSSSQKTLMTSSTVLTLGGYPAENAYFAGLFDEFRVWNIARSAADITSTMKTTLTGSEPGLVGYWQFNESSGTTTADSAKPAGHTAHNGTLMAASTGQNPTFVVPNPPSPVSCP